MVGGGGFGFGVGFGVGFGLYPIHSMNLFLPYRFIRFIISNRIHPDVTFLDVTIAVSVSGS